ncbi:hypothetical protein ACHAWF_015982 [Thalassiosira exigua]
MDIDSSSPMINAPMPRPGLRPRSASQDITQSFRDQLLEDWPHASTCSAGAQDWQLLCQKLRPRVAFSERSAMFVYRPDPHYSLNKSYTKREREGFSTKACLEAIRIKKLASTTPCESSKDSFKYLLKNKLVSIEEMVGIEHLVFGKSPSKIQKERKDHAKAVLTEQWRQRFEETKMQGDPMGKLGQFAALRSAKSAKRARTRAAIAA